MDVFWNCTIGKIITGVALINQIERSVWENLDRGCEYRLRSRLSHTDQLSTVNKMFIIWRKQEQFNLFNVTGLTDILLVNSNDLNLILPKFVDLFTFFSSGFLARP